MYAFATEIDRCIEALSEKDYHQKIGRSKTLREELYPLSRLALSYKQPGLDVAVEGFENSGRADGRIRITGYFDREFEVQVTYAGYDGDDALRAELLVFRGCAPGAGPIHRDKKSGGVIATMSAVDCDEHIERLSVAIKTQFWKKASKRYHPGTVLLIACEEIKLRGRIGWKQLLSAIEREGGFTESQFAEVYLFNGATNELYNAT
ncbi:hypothetical protein [Collimonas silvisoli]|uniref:hypothetical protein n=1 Tax=Collimonas silvisoli TaxID=2825884 RepID=UPI001B8B9CA8|nr:hypothetical protein [Collimonas silvisoli]